MDEAQRTRTRARRMAKGRSRMAEARAPFEIKGLKFIYTNFLRRVRPVDIGKKLSESKRMKLYVFVFVRVRLLIREHRAQCSNGNKILLNSLLFITISGRTNFQRVILRSFFHGEKAEKNERKFLAHVEKSRTGISESEFERRTNARIQPNETINAFKPEIFLYFNENEMKWITRRAAPWKQYNNSELPVAKVVITSSAIAASHHYVLALTKETMLKWNVFIKRRGDAKFRSRRLSGMQSSTFKRIAWHWHVEKQRHISQFKCLPQRCLASPTHRNINIERVKLLAHFPFLRSSRIRKAFESCRRKGTKVENNGVRKANVSVALSQFQLIFSS